MGVVSKCLMSWLVAALRFSRARGGGIVVFGFIVNILPGWARVCGQKEGSHEREMLTGKTQSLLAARLFREIRGARAIGCVVGDFM